MPVIVDQREPRAYQQLGDAVRYIPNGWGDFWLVSEIPAEDMMLYPEKLKDDGILLRAYERKKLNDLWYSRISGRLNKQMVATEVLIVEMTARIRRSVSEDGLVEIINSASEHSVVKFALGPAGIGKLVRADEKKAQRGEPFGLNRVQVVDDHTSDRRLRVLHALGVNRNCSKKLLKKYRTLWGAIENIDDWDSIRGIGPVTIKKAKENLHG